MLKMLQTLFWNSHQRRIRALWRLLIFIGIVGGVGLPLLIAIDASDNGWLENSAEQPAVAVAVVLALWVSARYTDRRPVADFGLSFSRAWWRDVGVGFIIGGISMSAIFLVLYLAGWVTVEGFAYTNVVGVSFGLAFLGQLFRAVGTGIFEEILMRAYLFRVIAEGLSSTWINRRKAVLISWMVTSAVFGVLHLRSPSATPLVGINIILGGLFLGFGMVYTGRIALPIGIHAAWNFFQTSIFGLGSTGRTFNTSLLATETSGPELWAGGSFGPEGGLLVIGAFALGTLLLWSWIRYQSGMLALHVSLADPPSLVGDFKRAIVP